MKCVLFQVWNLLHFNMRNLLAKIGYLLYELKLGKFIAEKYFQLHNIKRMFPYTHIKPLRFSKLFQVVFKARIFENK